MASATCYHLVWNSTLEEFEKHSEIITSADIVGISGFCPTNSEHVILISATPIGNTDVLLNLSADDAVISGNTDVSAAVTSAESVSSVDPDINTSIDGDIVDMPIKLNIVIQTPIVKANYNPLPRTKPTSVVKKN